ncbi:unnamed protein product [Coffea canephora]|uniref:Uncharacterized protein n=1 Tax=Coffea canephora TaxID=49390 RepID=A0A068VC23_COFCA|nr:unnamed protein product [Coffea canephora]
MKGVEWCCDDFRSWKSTAHPFQCKFFKRHHQSCRSHTGMLAGALVVRVEVSARPLAMAFIAM